MGAATAPDVGAGLRTPEVKRGDWFTRLVGWYLRRHEAGRAHSRAERPLGATESVRANAAIRRACIKSAVTGAAAGLLSTGATIVTAETEGLATVVTLPVAALTIGGEMIYRSVVHLQMTFELADIFDVHFDPDEPTDLWRLYALAFKTEAGPHEADEEDLGHSLVSRIAHVEGHEVGESIGAQLLGESVMRNVVPVAGIVMSAVQNWRLTRRVGDTVRRYARYHRALGDALTNDGALCHDYIDLLIEGLWFIFTADGGLNYEEAALLAGMLKRLDPVARAAVQSRFLEDEIDWIERVKVIPESQRDPFLNALEVAAAVDKEVSLPERKILRRVSSALGREFDMARLERMMREFEEVGVLRAEAHVPGGACPPEQP